MTTYILTNSMKRHERAELCIRLHREMKQTGLLGGLLKPLAKMIDDRVRSEKRNYFSPSKEPIHAIKSGCYNGVPFYLIMNKTKNFDLVFNSSPVDSCYVEFVKMIGDTSAIVFTQHALDRYNERVHRDKFVNHRDIMQQFIINNPIKTDVVHRKRRKAATQRVNEGFLCGHTDRQNGCTIINTFYDCEESMDNLSMSRARRKFKKMTRLSRSKAKAYRLLNSAYHNSLFSKDEYDMLISMFRMEVQYKTA